MVVDSALPSLHSCVNLKSRRSCPGWPEMSFFEYVQNGENGAVLTSCRSGRGAWAVFAVVEAKRPRGSPSNDRGRRRPIQRRASVITRDHARGIAGLGDISRIMSRTDQVCGPPECGATGLGVPGHAWRMPRSRARQVGPDRLILSAQSAPSAPRRPRGRPGRSPR